MPVFVSSSYPFFVDNINILCALNAKVKALLHFELKKNQQTDEKKGKKVLAIILYSNIIKNVHFKKRGLHTMNKEELVQDIISILHVFSCRIYGLRKYKKKIKRDEEIAKSLQSRDKTNNKTNTENQKHNIQKKVIKRNLFLFPEFFNFFFHAKPPLRLPEQFNPITIMNRLCESFVFTINSSY